MPVSLAEAKNNAQEDLDVAVIDEFRKESAILDSLIFDDVVNPAGGGATLDYGYRRLVTQASADFRAINSEYTPAEVESQKFSVTLAPLGGSFRVDRVLAKLGPAASGAVSLNLAQKIKATRTKFQDEVINGDVAADADGFDGLDKALTGSSTEMITTADWTDFDTNNRAEHKALDLIDEFLGLLDGAPTVLVTNRRTLARVRAAARRAGMYTKNPVDGLVDAQDRPITREQYGNVLLVDAGEKDGSNEAIVPVAADGTTSIYAYRVGLDGFHAVSTAGGQLVQTWLPDFTTSGAVKTGEVEMGPVGVALKATKSAAVLRGVKVAAGA